jgi:hypothetical protein
MLIASYPCACVACGWAGAAWSLRPIHDLLERVCPGEEVPAGECPDCGAFAYPAARLGARRLWFARAEELATNGRGNLTRGD